jgi:hypothetical protein
MGARFLSCGAAIILLQKGFQPIRQDFESILSR